MRTRLQLAKKEIQTFFDDQENSIYRLSDLREIFNRHSGAWRLKKSETLSNFIKELTEITRLKKIELDFPNRKETRFVWGDVPIYRVMMDLNPTCYFSHYTAMFLNELTEQIPKTIFLNTEQTPKPAGFITDIEQKNIDAAFRNQARGTNNITTYADFKIYHLSGKFTNNLGVVEYELPDTGLVRTTNIERTLIDAVVRPGYSGGVFEIKKAFEAAKDKLSVNKLLSYLQKLNYKYPYHQSIGFYLEKASYSYNQLKLVDELEKPFNFYLDYKMGEMNYDAKWKIYYPRGL